MRLSFLTTFLIAVSASSLAFAQSPPVVARSSLARGSSSPNVRGSIAAQTAEDRYGSFGRQALGGTLGSAAGLGVGLAATDDCTGDDDVVCALQSLSVTGALGVLGATIGVGIAGHSASERPSIVGSILGAAAGTVIGVGLHHLITEEANARLNRAATFALFTISQGTLAAAGGRIGAVIGAGR